MLALLMEKMSQRRMKAGSGTAFLTEAALFLQCGEIAKKYNETGIFPRILLVDDTLFYGRHMNHLIKMLEEEMLRRLDDDEYKIRNLVMDSVRLHYFARPNRPVMLNGSYEMHAGFVLTKSTAELHYLSAYISGMIVENDIANASYIYSQNIEETVVRGLGTDEYLRTSYHNAVQYTKVRFVGTNTRKKAAFTLRIMESHVRQKKTYRGVPFVFLPNLDEKETKGILRDVQGRMKERGIREEYVRWLDDLFLLKGKRTFNQVITLIFSAAILQAFNRRYGVRPDEEGKTDELLKLARNYDRGGKNGLEEAYEFVRVILDTELFSVEELEELIEANIGEGRPFVCISTENRRIADDDRESLIRRIEDYFYERGRQEEMEAVSLTYNPGFRSENRAERYVVGNGIVFRELFGDCIPAQAQYGIAYYLQLMDAGVIALSAFASERIDVVGFAQFAKAGEQSQLIRPLRFYEWIPMLAKMEDVCRNRGYEFEDELERYSRSTECDFGRERKAQLLEFQKHLREKKECISDWMGNYLPNIELYDEADALEVKKRKVMDYIAKRLEHTTNYENYCRHSARGT